MPTRINPGDRVTLKLSKDEHRLILEESSISPELTTQMRLALVENDDLVVRLTLDDLEELVATVAEEGNNCNNMLTLGKWAHIFERVLDILEYYEDDDFDVDDLENDIFTDKDLMEDGVIDEEMLAMIPPDLQESLMAALKAKDCKNLNDINDVVDQVMADFSSKPREELGGLSPDQMDSLVYDDWDDPNGIVQLNTGLTLDDLQDSSLLANACTLLNAVLENGGSVKATPAGNLNREFVKRMIDEIIIPPELDKSFFRQEETDDEKDIIPLYLVRILLDMAGLLRKQRGKFIIAKKHEKLAKAEYAGELFARLFRTLFLKFNLAFFSGRPEIRSMQETAAFTLYMLSNYADEWQTSETLAPKVVAEIVFEEVSEVAEDESAERFLQSEILWPLKSFGLIEFRPIPDETKANSWQFEFRKSPLYDRFLNFDLTKAKPHPELH